MMGRVSWCALRPGPGVSAALLLLAGAAAALAATDGLTISNPWIRYIGPKTPAAGYFTLTNNDSHEATLTGASSPDCGQLMLHRSIMSNGMASMQTVPSVPVPAHGAVTFSPGGYHLMCVSPSSSMKPGPSVPVTLRFQDGTSLIATFPVRGAKGE